MGAMTDRIRVRFGWASDPTQALSGVTWTDESTKVRSGTITRGRDSWPGNWKPATCTLVLANDGTIDLDDGTYGARLRPGRAVIVEGKDSGGTWRPLFAGHIRPRQGITPTDTQGRVGSVTFVAADILATLAEPPLTALTVSTPNAAGCINGALAAAGYSSIDTDLDTDADGVTGFATGALAVNTTAGAYIQKAATSMGGELYATKAGVLAYDRRHAIAEVTRLNTSQATLTDTNPIPSGEVGYNLDAGVTRTWGDRNATQVRATDRYGNVSTAEELGDHPAVAGTYDLGALNGDAAMTDAVCTFWVRQTSQIASYPRTCTVNVATTSGAVDSDHLDLACLRELRDRLTFEYTVPGRSQKTHLVSIESMTHRFDQNRWDLDLTFLSCDHIDAHDWANWAKWGGTYSRWGGSYATSDWAP